MKFNQKKKIAVIGDVILDEYIFGKIERINPEAPVPLLKFKKKEYRLGGASNVANNIFSLGGHCVLIGRIGKDKKIKKILDEKNIHYDFIEDESLPTITKTRFISNKQQILRLDDEKESPINTKDIKKIIKKVRGVDIIIIADYAQGVITEELMKELKKLKKIILADLKIIKPELFKGVYLIKPNLEETMKDLGVNQENEIDVENAGNMLQKKYNSNILMGRGKEGLSLFSKKKNPLHIPAQRTKIFDGCGERDTIIATISVALASGKSLEESIVLANKAAGIVVSKRGTSTVSAEELFSHIKKEHQKIKTKEQIKNIVQLLKKQGKKIVFTNGCFDILHIGHTRLFNYSKEQGDILILGLNTDASIKRLKGPKRPVVTGKERAEILAELECIDYVVFFDENTPVDIIKELQPDVIVKGGDYDPKDYKKMPEAKVVHDYGGKVCIFNTLKGKATTNIIEKIKNDK